jgi:hypothetical protein
MTPHKVDSAQAESVKHVETTAYVVEGVGQAFELRDIILDEVRDDELMIEWKFSGVCHTVRQTPSDASQHDELSISRTSSANKGVLRSNSQPS